MALVPNADHAFIDPRKLTHYLLAEEHAKGGGKAGFFKSFGYSRANWQALRDALLANVQRCEVVETRTSQFGTTFEVNGPLVVPDGRSPVVLVAWMIRHGEDFPRLVTVVPSEETGS